MKTMNRRETSGGQAIVLVTLALFAMCGMMGLAMDMGWSFFVHKQAQTAADAAALGANQEAINRISGTGAIVSAFTCAAGGTTATQAECQTTAISCGSVVATSNLNSGCQYAKKNGFDWTTSRQNVTIQSNDGDPAHLPPTAPGVKNLVYWVTVRTAQTIPQLFSAVFKNTQGTVSAVATAGIAAAIGPGQFYGMNHRGDCIGLDPATATNGSNCGVDYTGSPGGGNQTSCGSFNANLCAPAGIVLSSQCNNQVKGTCDAGVAGDGKGAVQMGATLTIMGNGTTDNGSVTGTWNNMSAKALSPTFTTDAGTFQDPTATHKTPQPPLASELGSGSRIPACGLANGIVPANSILGAYQYYSYDSTTGMIDGKQLQFSGNVTFSKSSGTCPGGNFTPGVSQGSSQFPTYIFYGGMNAGAATITMDPGQYVMAGTKTQVDINGGNKNVDVVFQEQGANITGDSNTGTMWLFTDADYPGMANQLLNVPGDKTAINNLTQGSLYFKGGSMDLNGLIGSSNTGSALPPSLNAYSGIAWWQDRRNSDVGYNKAAGSAGCGSISATCSGDDGTVIVCGATSDCGDHDNSHLAAMLQANHVTKTSPGLVMDPGNANLAVRGVYYQPRGAWMSFVSGNAGFTCNNAQCPLEIITGALLLGQGTVSLNLAGVTNPVITYKPVLIH